MPIYAYKCGTCGHAKDVLQKISDAPLTVCPECGEATFSKQVTAAGFQLKGSGWYVTDFRNNDKGAAKGASAKSDAKDGGSSEAKPSPDSGSSSGGGDTASSDAVASGGGSATSNTASAGGSAPAAPATS
jgi:putative FmdB family regulatory protein